MRPLKRLLEMPFSGRQMRLAANRPRMSKEQFVNDVASSDLGRLAADLLWEKLVEVAVCDQFTPYPSDDLLKVFGLAEEDLDEDIIFEIITTIGSTVPGSVVLKEFGPVNTPADIVRLIEIGNPGNQLAPD